MKTMDNSTMISGRYFYPWLLLLGGTVLFVPACAGDGHIALFGYSSRPNYDTNIRTVRVPIFKNETYRRGLEFKLTEAVIREIELRTPYKVVPATCSADTELVGRVVSRNKNLVVFNQLGEVRDAETTITVEVKWNKMQFGEIGDVVVDPLRDPNLPPVPVVPVKPPPVIVQSMWSFRPELGESLVTAEKKMVDRMAQRIVEMMELPW